MLKRTPLFTAHEKLGARLIEFGGWEMPVHYSSIMDEHQAVRNAAGVFDISHMGEIRVRGKGAVEFLNSILTNDIAKLGEGDAQYTLMCNEKGGVIDDLYVYRIERDDYLLIVNASRIGADWDWFQSQYDRLQLMGGFDLTNVSDQFGAIALQGPRVAEFMDECIVDGSIGGKLVDRATALKKNELGVFVFKGHSIYAARTGYTGEDGFEVVAPAEAIGPIWERALSVGHAHGLQPAGLGARDTLRTEACYPLYGHELNEERTPIEAGAGFFVSLEKGNFIGRDVLAAQKASGPPTRCVAFRVTGRGAPPRPHYPIWSVGPDAAPIGEVASGTQSPTLGCGIGMGFVPRAFGKPGTEIEIEVRGKRVPAVVAPRPLYKRAG